MIDIIDSTNANLINTIKYKQDKFDTFENSIDGCILVISDVNVLNKNTRIFPIVLSAVICIYYLII